MPQSLAKVYVHLIFSTKSREPLITEGIETELHPYLAKVSRSLDSPTLAVNGTVDHVHLLVSLGRTVSISELVEEIKKRSSKWIKTKGPNFRHFHWQAGYGAFSIGQSNLEALKRYIAKQKQHHRQMSFQEEMRGLFQRYQIECDEKYVWD